MQPKNGSRYKKITTNSNNLVGHSFVRLTIKYNDGGTYSQDFGFYPSGKGGDVFTPESESGTFKDNSGHDFTQSLEKDVTANEFSSILNEAENVERTPYNLVTNNCTTFAVKAARLAGIVISGLGTFPIFMPIYGANGLKVYTLFWFWGANPASLGQDIIDGSYQTVNGVGGVKQYTKPIPPKPIFNQGM